MNFCKKCLSLVDEILISKNGYACKACVYAYHKSYREKNAEKISAQKKAWCIANKIHKAKKDKLYAQTHPDVRKKARKKWAMANKGLINSYTKKRRADQLQRTPKWLTDVDFERIQNEYKLAAFLTKLTGTSWHVDHILPLQGKNVSGLHVPSNLRVVIAAENVKKGNKYEVEYA
jgi:hypothetical protein